MTLQEHIRELVKYSKLSTPKFAEKVGFKTPRIAEKENMSSAKNKYRIFVPIHI